MSGSQGRCARLRLLEEVTKTHHRRKMYRDSFLHMHRPRGTLWCRCEREKSVSESPSQRRNRRRWQRAKAYHDSAAVEEQVSELGKTSLQARHCLTVIARGQWLIEGPSSVRLTSGIGSLAIGTLIGLDASSSTEVVLDSVNRAAAEG